MVKSLHESEPAQREVLSMLNDIDADRAAADTCLHALVIRHRSVMSAALAGRLAELSAPRRRSDDVRAIAILALADVHAGDGSDTDHLVGVAVDRSEDDRLRRAAIITLDLRTDQPALRRVFDALEADDDLRADVAGRLRD